MARVGARPARCTLFATLAALLGCSSTSTDPASGLKGTWAGADGPLVLGVTFNGDGTYELHQTLRTSATTAEDQVQTGTFTATGSWITFTPQRSSCPGPAPMSTAPYKLLNGSLQMTSGTTVFTLQPDTAPPAPGTTVQTGCFDSQGVFTPGSLAPVQG
jgi:hypothetical protein